MVTAGQRDLSYPWIDAGVVYWQESRPTERGRSTLMCRVSGGPARELTPAPFDLRTRIHEYGGRAYAVSGEVVVAIDNADQRVWRMGDPMQPLTAESGGAVRFGDMVVDLAHQRIIAVRETHGGPGGDASEPVNDLVAIPLDGSMEVTRLAGGHDFFAAPALSPDGRNLAWITWDHPDMPWDATKLWRAEIGADGALRVVAGGPDEAALQPVWRDDQALLYLGDRSGAWQVVSDEAGAAATGTGEAGGPLWQLGMRWHDVAGDGTSVCCRCERGFWRLIVGERALDLPFTSLGDVVIEGGKAVLVAGAPDTPPAIITVSLVDGAFEVLARGFELSVDKGFLSCPEPLTFTAGDGGEAHAFYYPPTSATHAAAEGELPPLIIRCHGGPTASASPALALKYQYWTSRGFAICDVNYRGSTGYGRAYRHALYGRWGELDVADCVAAARHLVESGRADPKRLAISGGSAGGYTVLCALAFEDVFTAGASAYGIGDLAMLARDTHKFEARYLDKLVGPWPEAEAVYRQRSPIHHTERLSCPVIFFQGLEDKVVPPNQASAMVAALDAKGIPVAHMELEGEGHGFRRADTRARVLEAELAFYCRIFGIEPAEPLPPLAIRNLEGSMA